MICWINEIYDLMIRCVIDLIYIVYGCCVGWYVIEIDWNYLWMIYYLIIWIIEWMSVDDYYVFDIF